MTELETFAVELSHEAARVALPFFRGDFAQEDKGGPGAFDPVTEADRAAEAAIRRLIAARYPDHGVIGEEYGEDRPDADRVWVLDPIDGTRAFITGLPLWGTLIALNDGQRPLLGVMNQPFTGERYVGTPAGAWRNGAPLKTRACASLSSARLMCTTPDMFDTPARRQAFDAVAAQAQLLRFGGDCYAYCMLASGFVDAIVEASLQPYDIQALMPIVEGAGGVVTAWDGGSAQNGGAVIACGDPRLHAQLVELLRHAA